MSSPMSRYLPAPGSTLLGALVGAVVATWFAGAIARPAPLAANDATPVSIDRPTDVLEASSRNFERVYDIVSPCVALIEAREEDPKAKVTKEDTATAVLLKPDGVDRVIAVTNAHVLEGLEVDQISMNLADGRAFHPKSFVLDLDTDIAVVELPVADVGHLKIGDSDKARIGEWVLAVGSPFGLTQSVTHGIISTKGQRQLGTSTAQNVNIRSYLQTDAAINPGNSGGPLVNMKGEMIGLNTAIASTSGSSSGVAFSIPAKTVVRVVRDLATVGVVRRGYLGIVFPRSFDPEEADRLGMSTLIGAKVESVTRGDPAEKAGVQAGDVVVRFNDVAVTNDTHLSSLVRLAEIGKPFELVVWRNRREVKLTVTVAERKD